MPEYIAENIVYSWLYIYPLLKVMHKHNYNSISFYWCNCLVFMNTKYEIKMIEKK